MHREHDPLRDERILNEVIVDCYDEDEEAMSWYYHLADELEFPITATVRFALKGGNAEVKPAQIVGVDPKSEQGRSLRLSIVEGGSQRVQYISPEDVVSMDTTPGNLLIINDWLYWHNHEMLSGRAI